jgi:YD repeat-containing protein
MPFQQGPCPNCGAIAPVLHESLGKRHPGLLIFVTIGAFLAILATVGFAGHRVLEKAGFFSRALGPRQNGESTRGSRLSEVPVNHGRVVRREELHGHGKLYFVPVGQQAIPVQSLADYYLEKFGVQITTLPQVEIRPADCVPERHQCVAEELEAEMTNAYPEISRLRDSVMIALTDEDIFPRELGWRFTYSLHSTRVGIVSTRRMNPAFWGDAPDDAVRLASTKQMLTKYVAMLYFHVPSSFDPTSVMFSPLTPNGGSDDIYESDLHSEESVNGRRGTPFPCLFFTYSYETHKIKPDEPVLTDCRYHRPVHSTSEENFETNLGYGQLTQRSMDIRLDSNPRIEFRRGYTSGYLDPMALGLGTNHTYNTYLSSDGLAALTVLNLNREDGVQELLPRVDSGRGFNPNAVYESYEDGMEGARMTWNSGHYKLQYRDGAWSTYLPCAHPGEHCYWISYQDGKGNALDFNRGARQELRELTASDHQGITFQSDDKQRIIDAKDTSGNNVSYEYDAAGCLARVRRADGQVTRYEYDPGHHMTSITVVRTPGAAPENVLTNEYDSQGRVVRQTLAGAGTYDIQYLATRDEYASELRVTNPAGQVLRISVGNDDYVARTKPIRFPAAAHR